MDEQYLVDVDKQPIRNAIFRTLAGVICAGSLFVFWSYGVRIYDLRFTKKLYVNRQKTKTQFCQ